jgi:hypothetical protein
MTTSLIGRFENSRGYLIFPASHLYRRPVTRGQREPGHKLKELGMVAGGRVEPELRQRNSHPLSSQILSRSPTYYLAICSSPQAGQTKKDYCLLHQGGTLAQRPQEPASPKCHHVPNPSRQHLTIRPHELADLNRGARCGEVGRGRVQKIPAETAVERFPIPGGTGRATRYQQPERSTPTLSNFRALRYSSMDPPSMILKVHLVVELHVTNLALNLLAVL